MKRYCLSDAMSKVKRQAVSLIFDGCGDFFDDDVIRQCLDMF